MTAGFFQTLVIHITKSALKSEEPAGAVAAALANIQTYKAAGCVSAVEAGLITGGWGKHGPRRLMIQRFWLKKHLRKSQPWRGSWTE